MIAVADSIDADVLRIRHEFLDMPGLTLTVAQTARLCSVSATHARQMLDLLAAEEFLVTDGTGPYRRAMPPTRV